MTQTRENVKNLISDQILAHLAKILVRKILLREICL